MNIVKEILAANALNGGDLVSKRTDLKIEEVVTFLLYSNSMKEAATICEKSEDSFEQLIRRHFSPRFPRKLKNQTWDNYLLSTIGLFKCSVCYKILPEEDLYYGEIVSSRYRCAECTLSVWRKRSSAYQANNREKCLERSRLHYLSNKDKYISRNIARKLNIKSATPKWADFNKIKEFYLNCPEGYHVDHIIPLKGKLVCGLHIETNLQYLTAEDNLLKSNKFIVE